MKKSVIILAAAILAATSAAMLSGCGSGETANGGADATAAASSQTEQSSAGSDTKAVIDAKDVVFSFNGVDVELNSDADAAVAALGEANDVSSQLSCHGEGDDKTYTYDGFVLNTYPLEGKDRVLEIVINSAGIPTSKGVEVGASAEDVKAAYGEDFREVGLYYAYDAGDGKSLQFFIEDGTVSEIDYYYNV